MTWNGSGVNIKILYFNEVVIDLLKEYMKLNKNYFSLLMNNDLISKFKTFYFKIWYS